jgi:hypothetical protein
MSSLTLTKCHGSSLSSVKTYDLPARAVEKPSDLLVGDVAERGEDERGALVVWQPRQVPQQGARFVTRDHLGRRAVDVGFGRVWDGPRPAGAKPIQSAMASDPIEPRTKVRADSRHA